MDSEYDAIVVGAGHNGLIVANYLAKAGLKTIIIEAHHESGGGLASDEGITIPGYVHNTHSYFHEMIDVMPPYHDLALSDFGARYFKPEVQAALPTRDGRRALTFHRDLSKTCDSIAKFSSKDASEYRRVYGDYKEIIESIIIPGLYTKPLPITREFSSLEESAEGLELIRMFRSAPIDLLHEFFESEELISSILYQLAYPRGILPDYFGLGVMVPLIISGAEESQISIGSSHALAHALWKSLIRSGGDSISNNGVEKIFVKDNRATAVKLSDGSVIKARKAIISAIDLKQTFLTLVGEDYIEKKLASKIKSFKLDEFSIFSVHLALNEIPRYKVAEVDGAVNQTHKVLLGCESSREIMEAVRTIREGKVPKFPMMFASCPTQFDPYQAPLGKHTGLLSALVPCKLEGSLDAWDDAKESVCLDLLSIWKDYVTNLSEQNIIKYTSQTPKDTAVRFRSMPDGGIFHGRLVQDQLEYFRPLPELSQFKTPIDQLYLAGSSMHPGGGITGAPGYIAANVIAEDLGLEKWWEKS